MRNAKTNDFFNEIGSSDAFAARIINDRSGASQSFAEWCMNLQSAGQNRRSVSCLR